MSDTRFPITWNSLIDDLETAKYGKIRDIQAGITDYISETSSEASEHSNTSPLNFPTGVPCSPIPWNTLVDALATAKYGKFQDVRIGYSPETSQASAQSNTTRAIGRVVRTLDHQRCFVTNGSRDTKVTYLLDISNAGNTKLVNALCGLGVVQHNFNLGDISNLLLMSRRLHPLWNEYAAFVIVPSEDTRTKMIEIVVNDRERIMLALGNNEVVKPCPLAYPESVTYDVILVRPSLFGSEGWYFQRADNHGDTPTCYRIPTPSKDLHNRLEYLTKRDDEAHVSEFLNISHVTGRSSQQAINPYLMVMNALPKLKHWYAWGVGSSRFTKSVPDSVFTTAFEDCREIMTPISTRMNGLVHPSSAIHDVQAQGIEGDGVPKAEDGGKALRSTSSGDLAKELKSPADSSHLHHDPSMQPGAQSSI